MTSPSTRARVTTFLVAIMSVSPLGVRSVRAALLLEAKFLEERLVAGALVLHELDELVAEPLRRLPAELRPLRVPLRRRDHLLHRVGPELHSLRGSARRHVEATPDREGHLHALLPGGRQLLVLRGAL